MVWAEWVVWAEWECNTDLQPENIEKKIKQFNNPQKKISGGSLFGFHQSKIIADKDIKNA